MADEPLLVFGPRSLTYDFGPRHPLSLRRFGPGIELLEAVGAVPGLAPETASEEELEWIHSAGYIATVRRFSAEPRREPEAGIGPGDDPAFAGMHDAAASVAGGSLRAIEAVLRGDTLHAYHPGGGLHHAMRDRASGFCVYNDVALAIARARRDGLRVLYVDLDVHHGDGVQAIHYSDPGVMTISFHESGWSLFPGTGFIEEQGEGSATGTAINVPLEPHCGPDTWLAAVRAVVPPLAAAFGPDVVVSQHGADGHAWDPLAHLALTSTVMGEAARLVDRVAHRYAGGRWLATGGGGYSIYRVVPRVWALTWLAAAHRETPDSLPERWRERWSADAARWGDSPLPHGFNDAPGSPPDHLTNPAAAEKANETVLLVRTILMPALLTVAEARGWWQFDGPEAAEPPRAAPAAEAPPAERTPAERTPAQPAIVSPLTLDMMERLVVERSVTAPADPAVSAALLRAALADGGVAVGAVTGDRLVGAALAMPTALEGVDRLVALGVAPKWRRGGVATSMLRALTESRGLAGRAVVALHAVGERDPFDPLPPAVRRGAAEEMFRASGMTATQAPHRIRAADRHAFVAVYLPPGASTELHKSALEWAETL